LAVPVEADPKARDQVVLTYQRHRFKLSNNQIRDKWATAERLHKFGENTLFNRRLEMGRKVHTLTIMPEMRSHTYEVGWPASQVENSDRGRPVEIERRGAVYT
jgi:hypothetical protein